MRKLFNIFCDHRWELLKWDERVAHKMDVGRKCEFYFQCLDCDVRKNVKSYVRFSLIDVPSKYKKKG